MISEPADGFLEAEFELSRKQGYERIGRGPLLDEFEFWNDIARLTGRLTGPSSVGRSYAVEVLEVADKHFEELFAMLLDRSEHPGIGWLSENDWELDVKDLRYQMARKAQGFTILKGGSLDGIELLVRENEIRSFLTDLPAVGEWRTVVEAGFFDNLAISLQEGGKRPVDVDSFEARRAEPGVPDPRSSRPTAGTSDLEAEEEADGSLQALLRRFGQRVRPVAVAGFLIISIELLLDRYQSVSLIRRVIETIQP